LNRNEVIASLAEQYTSTRKFASIEWLVEQRGREIARGQSGHLDADAKTKLPPSPIYRIYSMTKPVVSVMALILIEQGKLRLYDFLPQFDAAFANMRVLLPSGQLSPAERPITVEDLLTHRAGFTYEFISGCHIAALYDAARVTIDGHCSLEEMMKRLAPIPLAFQPGTKWRYSVCVDVLAHVIERAARKPLDELLKTYLFDPLGMTDTAFFVPKAKQSRLLPMYGETDVKALSPIDPPPHELKLADPRSVNEMYPSDLTTFRRGGHGLFSTTDDYARFARMLLDGKAPDGKPILSRKMIEMMRANRLPPEQLPLQIGLQTLPGYGWGLGVRVMIDTGKSLVLTGSGELGWSGAASTYFWVDPAEAMIGVVMTQFFGAMLPMVDDLKTAAYQMLA